MSKHRGEIVNERVRKSGIKIVSLITGLGIARPTYYAWIDNPNLGLDEIMKIGKIINYDFSQDFPEISSQPIARESESDYKKTTLPDCLKERDDWRDKYIDLLESHNLLLKGELQKLLTKS